MNIGIVEMKKLIIAVLAFMSTSVFASGYLVPLGQGVEVLRVHAHSGGGLTLWIHQNSIQNPDSCKGTDKVHIRSSLAGYDAMVTVVMSAYTAKKKIGFWSSGCSTIPFWGGTITYPIVHDLWITD